LKAYAQFIEKDGITYRLNTLLQFGNSWEHIGNIILANPGSSDIIEKISDDIDNEISNLYTQFENRVYRRNDWVECKVDSTMSMIEKIFDGYYVDNGNTIELNGVIQLFNSFNIKNQNLEEAINSLPLDNELLYSTGIEKYFNNKPTYFGFTQAVIGNERLKPIATDIFEKSSSEIKSFYKESFCDNQFYHPMYINKSYKKNNFDKYKHEVLIPFRNLVMSCIKNDPL